MGELFTWYNVLFTAPLFFVFLFAILQLIGVSFQFGGGGGGGEPGTAHCDG